MWVRFIDRFNWSPPEKNNRVTLSYKTGTVHNVTKACAEAAIAAGKAARTINPRFANARR